MVYRLIVILVFGGMVGSSMQAAQSQANGPLAQPFNASSFLGSLSVQ